MPRPRGSGLNVTRKKRRDGSVVEYFYERGTGRFLGHTRAAALDRIVGVTPEQSAGQTVGTLARVITDYLASPEYRRLAPNTRKLYRGYLDEMRETWGDIAVRSLTAGDIRKVRDKLAGKPAKANMILALFRILLGRAKADGLVRDNVAREPGRLPMPPRVEIWTHAAEESFLDAALMDAAGPTLQLAMLLLLYTVQRPSDVLDMRIERISERAEDDLPRLYIALRQSKTGQLLDLPVHARLEPFLRQRIAQAATERDVRVARGEPDRVQYLIPSPRGLRWSRRNFSRAWDRAQTRMYRRIAKEMFRRGFSKEVVRAELSAQHRQRRDLRRTGIVRLAEAKATIPQIAAISGHTVDYCQRIIDTYLPRTTAVAVGGMLLWERYQATASSTVVSLGATRRARAG